MKLFAPKFIFWLLALILGVVGLVGYFVPIALASGLPFWAVLVGLALLLLSTAVTSI